MSIGFDDFPQIDNFNGVDDGEDFVMFANNFNGDYII